MTKSNLIIPGIIIVFSSAICARAENAENSNNISLEELLNAPISDAWED